MATEVVVGEREREEGCHVLDFSLDWSREKVLRNELQNTQLERQTHRNVDFNGPPLTRNGLSQKGRRRREEEGEKERLLHHHKRFHTLLSQSLVFWSSVIFQRCRSFFRANFTSAASSGHLPGLQLLSCSCPFNLLPLLSPPVAS